MEKQRKFCEINNITFNNEELIKSALTHSTYAYENSEEVKYDNERLEYLGDAVLQLVISEALFHLKPALDEGLMTKYRALIVCEDTLTQVAEDIDLGKYLYLGKGEEMTGGREKASNLSNALEATFGAIYLDQGFAYVQRKIIELLQKYIDLAVSGKLIYDFKSSLLEMVQATRGSSTMNFEIIAEEGPVHDRTYTAAVNVDEHKVAVGQGSSKKLAEQAAAKQALQILSCDEDGCYLVNDLEDLQEHSGE
ncbi:MAG: ribonuclease III [Clostridiaceae bacterium]|nr:ribonuclease III [Clostridiaceae bacterium]